MIPNDSVGIPKGRMNMSLGPTFNIEAGPPYLEDSLEASVQTIVGKTRMEGGFII